MKMIITLAAAVLISCSPALLAGVTSPDVPPHGYIYADLAEAEAAAAQMTVVVCISEVPDGFVTQPCSE